MSYDPLARRMYLLHCLAQAQNACEVLAANVALNATHREYPEIKRISYLEKTQTQED